MRETYEETLGDNCKHCLAPIAVRNPTGKCDHLCWPDYLTTEAKLANGIPLSEVERLRTLIDGLMKAVEPFAKADEKMMAKWPELADVAPLNPYLPTMNVGDLRRAREAYLKAKGE